MGLLRHPRSGGASTAYEVMLTCPLFNSGTRRVVVTSEL
jgi:hypothetical protein